MTKGEALKIAWDALSYINEGANNQGPHTGISWRCAANKSTEALNAIKAVLEARDEPVAHSVVAGALFDFMGWLTSREKRLILSSVDEASPAVEAITEFAKKRNLSLKYAEVGYWMEFLSTPPQQEAKNEPVGLIESLKDAKPCCGQYETCWRACTPRGKFIGQRDAQRKPLTDEEIQDALEAEFLGGDAKRNWQDDLRVARAIEAAHGIIDPTDLKGKA